MNKSLNLIKYTIKNLQQNINNQCKKKLQLQKIIYRLNSIAKKSKTTHCSIKLLLNKC